MLVRDQSGCVGCPFYQDGSQPFVPDEIRPNTHVFIMGQNPGAQEAAQGQPFVGDTGKALQHTFLPKARINRSQVCLGNALRCRVGGKNELPALSELQTRAALKHCNRSHLRIPSSVQFMVAMGAYALYVLTGEGLGKYRTITSWRGWALPRSELCGPSQVGTRIYDPSDDICTSYMTVFATVHLAALTRNHELKIAAMADWTRFGRLLRGQWPSPLPPYVTEGPEWLPNLSTFDTEYDADTLQLHRYSMHDGQQTWVVEAENVKPIRFVPRSTVVLQNADADLATLSSIVDLAQVRVDDTMLADSVLWSGLPHDLEYLGSLYGSLNRWKHLYKTNPLDYSAADAVVTWQVWQALQEQFMTDPASWTVYDKLTRPLIPILRQAHTRGIRLDQERVRSSLTELVALRTEAELKAHAAVGWPINLASPEQVSHELYDIRKVRVPRRTSK